MLGWGNDQGRGEVQGRRGIRLYLLAGVLALIVGIHGIDSQVRRGPEGIVRAAGSSAFLTVDESELNLGELYEAGAYERAIHLRNAAEAPIIVKRFLTDCACAGIVPDRDVTLAPGESKAFLIKLALRPDGDPHDMRPVQRKTMLGVEYSREGGKNQSSTWFATFTLLPTLRVLPPVLRIGDKSELMRETVQEVTVLAAQDIEGIDCVRSRRVVRVGRQICR
jgi:hypothetical protein